MVDAESIRRQRFAFLLFISPPTLGFQFQLDGSLSVVVAQCSRLRHQNGCQLKQKENAEISRIFSVKDPNVDVIYVSPFTLTSDVYKYYVKILELVEIESPEKRFNIVVPENYVKFP